MLVSDSDSEFLTVHGWLFADVRLRPDLRLLRLRLRIERRRAVLGDRLSCRPNVANPRVRPATDRKKV
jgi:hypothetical protein